MGADITLGIHLETAPMDPNTNLSSFGVLGQSISVMSAVNVVRSMEHGGHTGDGSAAEIYHSGLQQSRCHHQAGIRRGRLQSHCVVCVFSKRGRVGGVSRKSKCRRKTTPIPKFVEVTGTSPEMAKAMEKQMASLVGQPVEPRKLTRT